MNSGTASSILFFVVTAFALGSTILSLLSSRKPTTGRLPAFLFFVLGLGILSTVSGALGLLAARVNVTSAIMNAYSVSSSVLRLFAGSATLYLLQEPSLLKGLNGAFGTRAPRCVRNILLVPAALLFASFSTAIVARFSTLNIPELYPSLRIVFFAIACGLIGMLFCARQMHDGSNQRLVWPLLMVAQVFGILSTVLELDTRPEPVLKAVFTIVWFICTILAFHIYASLPPSIVLPPPVQSLCAADCFSLEHKQLPLDTAIVLPETRARHPSSPITPTEDYLRVMDPFAGSPPPSTISHCFDDADLELEKLSRSPSAHKRTYSDVVLPSLYLEPTPRRGLAPAPLPAFPRELMRAAQHARDSSETSSRTLVDAHTHAKPEPASGPGWKSRFRESFSTFASS